MCNPACSEKLCGIFLLRAWLCTASVWNACFVHAFWMQACIKHVSMFTACTHSLYVAVFGTYAAWMPLCSWAPSWGCFHVCAEKYFFPKMEVLCQATAGRPLRPRRSIPAPLLARGDLPWVPPPPPQLAGFPFRLTQPTYLENTWPDPSVYIVALQPLSRSPGTHPLPRGVS